MGHLLEVDLEAELLELALHDGGRVGPRRRVVTDHGDLAVGAFALATRETGLLHVLRSDLRIPIGVRHEVEVRALEPAGLLETGEVRRQVVGRDRAGQLSTTRVPEVGPVRVGDDRPADVDVVEGRLRRVQRHVAVATARRQGQLTLLAGGGGLLDGTRRRREVAVDHRAAGQHLLGGRHGVREALLDGDLVEVGGTEVTLRRTARRTGPARVANQVDLLVGRVAGELAVALLVDDLAVVVDAGVLDHVRAGRDLVLAVRRRVLRVVLLRILLRHRGADREGQGTDHADRGRVRELDLERRVVRRSDPADVGSAAGRVVLGLLDRLVDPLDPGQIGLDVAVRDARQQRSLDRVLDVLGGHRPVHRRRVLDVVADRVGDRLAVVGDGRGLGRQQRCCMLDVGRGVALERRQRRRVDHVGPLVIGRARVDVVDVAGRDHGQIAAGLRIGWGLGRGRVLLGGLAGAARARAVAATAGGKHQRRNDQCPGDQHP